jgi:hypothetical protein
MKSMGWSGLSMCVLLGSLLAACSSGREVEVTGEVTAGSSSANGGPIRIEFIDIVDEAAEAENEVVHSVELTGPGAFAEKVSLEGEKVLVRAILDADESGACSAGETWAEAEASVADDDTVQPLTITLSAAACP